MRTATNHGPDYLHRGDIENLNPNTVDMTSYEGEEETPTGYDLTLRKVVDVGRQLVCGMDHQMNLVHGKAGGAFGMARKIKFDGLHNQIRSSAIRKEFDKVKDVGDMKESFYNRSLLERQVLGMRHQNPPVEQLMELHGIHDESEGTPDWTLNLPEAQFIECQ